MKRKITIIGGGGVRTPLLIHGLAKAHDLLNVSEVSLFDVDVGRTEVIASLGREIVQRLDAGFEIAVHADLAEAVRGTGFILNSVRVGGIAARARDERLAIEHGLAGQETTGPGGVAMALRTIPVTLDHARVVERVAPDAWFINFTNPAGLVTQALCQHTRLRAIGICDTPTELFHRIAGALGAPLAEMSFDYAGLNHLGWIRRVTLRGEDVTERLLGDEAALSRIYPAGLFDPAMIQTLRLIPTEYLFFYYRQRRAYENQLKAGASRGEELEKMNVRLFDELREAGAARGLDTYRRYLLQRNASYMKIETEAESAFSVAQEEYDPFETATGYHRVALDVIQGLVSSEPRLVLVNVPNQGAIDDLDEGDVAEVPCDITRDGPIPRRTGRLPESVRGLVLAVKAYEDTTIRAAVERSGRLADLAMLECPLIGQWDLACEIRKALVHNDPAHLGYLA